MIRDLCIEIHAPLSEADWAVIEEGDFTGAKLRRSVAEVMDWGRLYRALRRNTPNPSIYLRSNSNVSDAVELADLLAHHLPTIRGAGFRRVYCLVCNEPNNESDWDLARWLREGPGLVEGWLALKAIYPDVLFVSPAMKPELPSVARQWHLPRFDEFDLLGQHTYHRRGNFFWSPWDLRNLYPDGPPIMVLEFNDTQAGDGLIAANLAMLDVLAAMPYVVGVTFFAVPAWQGGDRIYDVSVEEARIYGAWFRKQNGGGDVPNDGGIAELMELAARFPDKWKAWCAAGGDSSQAFRLYLVGQGDIAPQREDVDLALNKVGSGAKELELILEKVFPKG